MRMPELKWLRALWSVLAIPLIACAVIAWFFLFVAIAQKKGWITLTEPAAMSDRQAGTEQYICPMMCVPATNQPGRCPVCGMELVLAGESTLDPQTRRILNIQTAVVKEQPAARTIRSVGEMGYDESRLMSLSAWVDGRVEKMFASYTGAQVRNGDPLAIIYSPQLYASQVEYLAAGRSGRSSDNSGVSGGLLQKSRQRLSELGMTDGQIAVLESSGEATSRYELAAPIAGTIIEKLAVDGQYIETGDVIYRLADLSRLWLMLRLFPEDAAHIRAGQKVIAEVQSHPDRKFVGEVEFVSPSVDPESRTVSVRIAIDNSNGELRVGDYTRASIEVPVSGTGTSADGATPAAVLVVPRDAVLMAGKDSVVYIEVEPGRFEMRNVIVGPEVEEGIVILAGLAAGDVVATRGNFLIDSQMQLAGNPSLIDPTRARPAIPRFEEPLTAEIQAEMDRLSEEDRRLAMEQRFCPVQEMPLGSMGAPIKVDVKGIPVFICCEGCRTKLLEQPEKYLKLLNSWRTAKSASAAKVDSETSQRDGDRR
jgi:membrane fusion protein, copper/silver efflux system